MLKGPLIRSPVVATIASALCPVMLHAAEISYEIDPSHTFPSFEADHMGLSIWRGKLNKTAGKLLFDKTKGQGSVDVKLDPSSIDFGVDKLNEWATSKDFFDCATFPEARYRGTFSGLSAQGPTSVQGELTLHGVTKPVELKINFFKCMAHPLLKRELCGADVAGTFNRESFGLSAGKDYGFAMDVSLRIQVEAIAEP